jgi:predicted enzyme related to lactoylglutathione lyase
LYTRRAALTLVTAAVPAWSQSRKTVQPGGGHMGHPVVHFEIGYRDQAKTERFFADLFGWHIQQNGPASTIDTASQQGIPGHITSLSHEPHHYTMFYVEVDDVQAYLDKAAALGGKTLVPPIKIPTGTFAWLSDLDGNTIGLLKPEP